MSRQTPDFLGTSDHPVGYSREGQIEYGLPTVKLNKMDGDFSQLWKFPWLFLGEIQAFH
jgi:hypothetical protein